MCCRRLYDWLKVAPYHADQQLDEDDDAFDSSKGLRVMGVAYSIDKYCIPFILFCTFTNIIIFNILIAIAK